MVFSGGGIFDTPLLCIDMFGMPLPSDVVAGPNICQGIQNVTKFL